MAHARASSACRDVGIITHYAYLALEAVAWRSALMRDMVARGYTAQEIMQLFQVLEHRMPRTKADYRRAAGQADQAAGVQPVNPKSWSSRHA